MSNSVTFIKSQVHITNRHVKQKNKKLSSSVAVKYFHFYCFMMSFYSFMTYYTEWTEWSFMSRASIHFTDSIHLHVNGSHHLQHVNNSFQRERAWAETFIWKTICYGQMQQEGDPLKRAKALWLKSDKVQSHSLPHCFHLGLFPPVHPSEAWFHWSHAAKTTVVPCPSKRQGLVEM